MVTILLKCFEFFAARGNPSKLQARDFEGFFRAAKAAGTVRCLSLHSLHATLINLSSYADYISY